MTDAPIACAGVVLAGGTIRTRGIVIATHRLVPYQASTRPTYTWNVVPGGEVEDHSMWSVEPSQTGGRTSVIVL